MININKEDEVKFLGTNRLFPKIINDDELLELTSFLNGLTSKEIESLDVNCIKKLLDIKKVIENGRKNIFKRRITVLDLCNNGTEYTSSIEPIFIGYVIYNEDCELSYIPHDSFKETISAMTEFEDDYIPTIEHRIFDEEEFDKITNTFKHIFEKIEGFIVTMDKIEKEKYFGGK